MKNIYNICKTCLGILIALISIYVIKECVFGHYIEGVLMAKTLPLSITLIAIAILFFAIENKNKGE
ncbi:hypothetical protein [Anaerococcus lactolyticus]|uniref:hypothetical protein n=1 Tax=Anaerococcus lactolyticus TaxID=33032 RepID=UPI00288B54C7|nr:hypothetical protein [Anaerococcus lactolyticus]